MQKLSPSRQIFRPAFPFASIKRSGRRTVQACIFRWSFFAARLSTRELRFCFIAEVETKVL